MTRFEKAVKYAAIVLAIMLAVGIVGGIIGAIGSIGGFLFNDATSKDMQTYTVSSEISSLYIDVGAADITIKQGDGFSVESNLKKLKVEDENGVLSVKEKSKPFGRYNDPKLIITLPADKVFEKAELVTGAGVLNIDRLAANILCCEFGAGEINIESLTATRDADIDGDAGKITISGGALHNLDLDMGVGELNLTSALTGECELDLGVGESNITLIGSEDDYRFDISKGIGSISVDGKTVSDTNGFGNGQNCVEVNGGVGAININFK